jgi:putative tricarboxylic transport membrane protein
MMLLGLSLVAAFSNRGEYLKALMMTCLGLMLATVGTDLSAGVQRFTFGRMDLIDGISFLTLAMATFALAEAFLMILRPNPEQANQVPRYEDLRLNQQELKDIAPSVGRSSMLGFLVGTLPGAGATIASFLAYGMERNFVKQTPVKFGDGNLAGLAAPESANNAACTGSFVPLLTLGIPGSGTTAVLLGALIAYGVQPGPRLFVDAPEVFWSVIVSMYIGNIFLLILNLPLIPQLARLLTVPRQYLVPAIMFFSVMGVYLVSFNSFDIQMMIFIAVGAIILRLLEFPMAPLLLGFILGGMLEDNLRRALTLTDGSWAFLWERDLTLGLFVLLCVSLIAPLLAAFIRFILARKAVARTPRTR